MAHNEEVYPNPFDFNPERFLGLDEDKSKGIDPKNFVFGFGRRICVGQFFADQQIWLAVACLVATVDVRKAKDKFGKEITPIPNYPGFAGYVWSCFRDDYAALLTRAFCMRRTPDSFPCVVTIRDENAARLIEEAVGV